MADDSELLDVALTPVKGAATIPAAEKPAKASAKKPAEKLADAPAELSSSGLVEAGASAVEDIAPAKPFVPADPELEDALTPLPSVSGGTLEQLEAAAQGAGSGALLGAGATAGAAVGVAVGAMTGPFAPVAVPLGGVIGLIGGLLAGGSAAEGLGLPVDVNNVPEGLRPAFVGGQVLGATVSGTGSTMVFANLSGRLAPSMVGNVINQLLDTAKRAPVPFALAELSAGGQAAIAEFGVEGAFPDRPLVRGAAGLAAGALSPATLTLRLVGKLAKKASFVASSFSPQARQTRAGKLLTEFVEGSDDPEILARALAETEEIEKLIPGFRGTLAQTTGEKRLAQLEAELGEKERKVFEGFQEKSKEAFQAISNFTALLRGVGTPEALKVAAQLRFDRFTNVVERLVAQARREAVEAASSVSKGALVSERTGLSLRAKDIYSRALDRVRVLEKDFWGKAFPDPAAAARGIRSAVSTLATLQGNLSSRQKLPASIAASVGDILSAAKLIARVEAGEKLLESGSKITKAMISKAERLTSVGELQRFRSFMLSEAREASTNPRKLSDPNARAFGLMAEAVLSDMVRAGVATRSIQEGGRRGQGGRFVADKTAFDEARDLTKAINDTFGRALGAITARTGPPETLLNRAFASGDELGALQLRELRDIVDFLPKQSAVGFEDLLDANAVDTRLMHDVQSRLLRLFAGRVMVEEFDVETGRTFLRPSLSQAKNFLREAGEVLKSFPDIAGDLKAAVKSSQTLAKWVSQAKKIKRGLGRDSAIGRVLAVDSVPDAVNGALGSLKPLGGIMKMIKLAKADGQEAVDGLRAVIFDATLPPPSDLPGDQQLASLRTTFKSLVQPMRPGLPSLVEVMEREGVMPAEAVAQLRKMAEITERVAVAAETKAVGEVVVDDPGIITNLLIRLSGSVSGSLVLRQVQAALGIKGAAGPSILMAGRFAQGAQDFVDRLPNKSVRQIIANALSGTPLPGGKRWSLLAALLDTASTPAVKIEQTRRLHAYAWQAGLLGAQDEIGVFEEEQEPETPSLLDQSLTPLQ